jgi:hypothetical protein
MAPGDAILVLLTCQTVPLSESDSRAGISLAAAVFDVAPNALIRGPVRHMIQPRNIK